MKTIFPILLLFLLSGCSFNRHDAGNIMEMERIDSFVASNRKNMISNPQSVIAQLDSISSPNASIDSNAYYLCQFYKAKCMYYNNDDSNALVLIDKVLDYCSRKSMNKNKQLSKLYILSYNLKGVFYQVMNKRDSSIILMKKAYNESIRSNYKTDISDICINIADTYRQQGNLVNSSTWYHKALTFCNELSTDKQCHSIMAGLGLVYADLNNFPMAHYYFQQAESKYPPHDDYERHFLYNSHGNTYYFEKKYDDALKYFRKSYDETKRMELLSAQAIVEANMAEIFTLTDELDSAHFYLNKARKFFDKPDIDSSLKFYFNGLYASLLLKENKISEAKKYLDIKCDSATIGKSYWFIHCKRLAVYYEKTGDYKNALKYQTKSLEYDDSLRNVKYKNNVSEIEYRFKHDNTILRKNIEIASRQKKETKLWIGILISVLVLLLMICVFVFIYTRIKQTAERNRNIQLSKIIQLRVQNAKNRLSPHFLFNILNILLPTPSYNSAQRKTIDGLILYLRSCLTNNNISSTMREEIDMVKLYVSLRQVSSSNVPPIVWDISDEGLLDLNIPSMIIQIPVENAIKYAFRNLDRDNDKIIIKVSGEREHNINIEIRDNGIGINSKNERPAATYQGTHNGISILYKMIGLLNKKNTNQIIFSITDLSTISNDEHGTVVQYTIPSIFNYD